MARSLGTSRGERHIDKRDVSEGTVLRDRVYDEEVEVVGVYVGQVYLRYPHHEHRQEYQHECGAILIGMDNLIQHSRECEEGDSEWCDLFENPSTTNGKRLAEMDENGELPFERVERDGVHLESASYDWPLDGHRFRVVEE